MRSRSLPAFLVFASLLLTVSSTAQRTYTAADYARAERLMNYNVNGLVVGTTGGITYLPDGRVFFHRSLKGGGTEYRVADPVAKTVIAPFDPAKLGCCFGRDKQPQAGPGVPRHYRL